MTETIQDHLAVFALLFGVTVLIAALNIAEPLIVMRFIDTVVVNRTQESSGAGVILAAVWAVLILVQQALLYVKVIGMGHMRHAQEHELRGGILDRWLASSPSRHGGREAGDLEQVALRDVEHVSAIWDEILLVAAWGATLIAASVCLAVLTEFHLAALIVAGSAAVGAVELRVLKLNAGPKALSRNAHEDLGLAVRTMRRCIRLIQIHAYEDTFRRRAEDASRNIELNERRTLPRNWAGVAFNNFFEFFALLLVMAVGGTLVQREHVTVGAVFAVVLYVNLMGVAFRRVAENLSRITSGAVAYSRVKESLEIGSRRNANHDVCKEDGQTHSLALKGVTFGYTEGSDVVKNLNLRADQGTVVFLTGGNGVGKTTVLRLLAGYAEPKSGTLLRNGEPVDPEAFTGHRSHVSVVEADESIMGGTVAFNLDPEDRGIRPHEYNLFASDTVLDCLLAQPAENLSRGQQQRVAVMRALLRPTDILLLDEPATYLDDGAIDRLINVLKRRSETGIVVVATNNQALYRGRLDGYAICLDKRAAQ